MYKMAIGSCFALVEGGASNCGLLGHFGQARQADYVLSNTDWRLMGDGS